MVASVPAKPSRPRSHARAMTTPYSADSTRSAIDASSPASASSARSRTAAGSIRPYQYSARVAASRSGATVEARTRTVSQRA